MARVSCGMLGGLCEASFEISFNSHNDQHQSSFATFPPTLHRVERIKEPGGVESRRVPRGRASGLIEGGAYMER